MLFREAMSSIVESYAFFDNTLLNCALLKKGLYEKEIWKMLIHKFA